MLPSQHPLHPGPGSCTQPKRAASLKSAEHVQRSSCKIFITSEDAEATETLILMAIS